MQRLSSVALGALVLSVPSALVVPPARAQGIQIQADVAGWQGLTVGARAGDRVVISAGLQAEVMEEERDGESTFSGRTFVIPVEVKLYVTDSVPEAVTPVIALGGHYGAFRLNDYYDDQLAGIRLMLGAEYFLDEHLGVHASVGPGYALAWGDQHDQTRWMFAWRAGFVLRP